MVTSNLLKRKMKDIKYNYGEAAAEHFWKHPHCEDCGDKRLVVLTLHHTHGRKVDKFQTLCFNCHMVVHNKKNEYQTFEICKSIIDERETNREEKNQRILDCLNKGMTIRSIIRKENSSMDRVRSILKENGFETIPRVGYFKKPC